MGLTDLSHTERVLYEAARADTRAQRWRIEAEIAERRGEPAAFAREQQREHEAEAAERWVMFAALKAKEARRAA